MRVSTGVTTLRAAHHASALRTTSSAFPLTTAPPHLASFEGGNALPDFRAAALLARLRERVARVDAIAARHVHWVASDAPLNVDVSGRVAALLRYGDPAR